MGKITVIGTGFDEQQLTLGAIRALESGESIILHTSRASVADYLTARGAAWSSLDRLYDECEDFDEHAQAAADCVTAAAREADVVYCVFDVRDRSAQILARRGAAVIPGPPAEGVLMAMAEGETRLFSAAEWENMFPDAACATIVREIDSRELAAEVKLRLAQAYADDADALFLSAGGVDAIRLYELDRLSGYDHRCSALVFPECDPRRKNACTLRDLMNLTRTGAYYSPGDFDEMCKTAARLAGQGAYAEDHGDFSLSDVITDACADIGL